MKKPIIFNSEPYGFSPVARELWQSTGRYVEGIADDPKLNNERAETQVLIVRLARYIDDNILSQFPNLRYVVSATTGWDHLDLNAMEKRGIVLVSLRGETEFLSSIPSTAEHTMALLLSLIRFIPAAVTSVRCGEWERDRFRGRQLKNRKLGIVGLGRTGRMVAQYASAFGAYVSYFDPYVNECLWTKKDTLSELLLETEILSLHVHLNQNTQKMIAGDELDLLAHGAYVLNTSRGALIDEVALVERLRTGKISGVAVDVLADEINGIKHSPLWQAMCDGYSVIVTPHIGGATIDAMQQCEEFIAKKCLLIMKSGCQA